MSMFQIFNVAGSAISAQSQRLNVVASNLANADTVAGPDGSAYKARQVVFQTELMGAQGAAGVTVSTISEDQTVGRRVHDPKHPAADAGRGLAQRVGKMQLSRLVTRRVGVGDVAGDQALALRAQAERLSLEVERIGESV